MKIVKGIILATYCITHLQSPSCIADSHSATQEIPLPFVWHVGSFLCLQEQSTVPVLIQINPMSLKYILVLSSHLHLGLPRDLFAFRLSNQNFVCISYLCSACDMSHSFCPNDVHSFFQFLVISLSASFSETPSVCVPPLQ